MEPQDVLGLLALEAEEVLAGFLLFVLSGWALTRHLAAWCITFKTLVIDDHLL